MVDIYIYISLVNGFLNQLAMGGHLSMYWVVPERVDSEGDWFIIERLPLV